MNNLKKKYINTYTNTLNLDDLMLFKHDISSNNNVLNKTRHYPPANKEWFNSVYSYNKNYLKSLPITDKVINNLLNNYFNLTSSLEKYKIKARNRRIRFKRLSNNRILLSRAEMKHTNNKVIITLYTYNRTLFCNGFSIVRNKIKLGKNIHTLKKSFFIGIAKITKKLIFTKIFTNIINPFDGMESIDLKMKRKQIFLLDRIRNYSILLKIKDNLRKIKFTVYNKRMIKNHLLVNILNINKIFQIYKNNFKFVIKLHKFLFFVYFFLYKNIILNNKNKFEDMKKLKKLIWLKWYVIKSLFNNNLKIFRVSARLNWNKFKEWEILELEDFIALSKNKRKKVLEYKKLDMTEKSQLKKFDEFKSFMIEKWHSLKESQDYNKIYNLKKFSLIRSFLRKIYDKNLLRFLSKVFYILKRYNYKLLFKNKKINSNKFYKYNKFNKNNKYKHHKNDIYHNDSKIFIRKKGIKKTVIFNNKLKNNLKEKNSLDKKRINKELMNNSINNLLENYKNNSLNLKRWIYKNKHLFIIKKTMLKKSMLKKSNLKKIEKKSIKSIFRKIENFKLKKWLFNKNIYIFNMLNLNKSIFKLNNLKLPVFYFYRNWFRKRVVNNNKIKIKFKYNFFYRIRRTIGQLFILKKDYRIFIFPAKYDIVFFNYFNKKDTLNDIFNKFNGLFENVKFYGNINLYTDFFKENLLQHASEKDMLKIQRNKLISKRLDKIMILYIYYVKMIYINNYKYKNWFILGLKNIISNIYKKKVEFNIVNLKYIHLNSDILSNSMAVKLKDRKKRILRVMKKVLKLIRMPSLKFFVRSKIIERPFLDKYKTLSINYNTKKHLFNYIMKFIKNKRISGIRIEGKGRLTKRLTASRSLFKVKYKGTLKDIASSYKSQSSVLLRGHMRPSLQYTQISSKTRNGAFGLKTWINN